MPNARFVVVAVMMLCSYPLAAQDVVDAETTWRIRQEGTDHSQILRTLHFLTDVHGPRLTGSPNLEAAGQWAVDQMTAWGLTNGHLEPFDFGHPGWLNERVSAHLVAPVKDTLIVEVLAWTPGTDGVVSGPVVHLMPPSRPTEAQLQAFFAERAGVVRDAVVLVGEHRRVPVTLTGPARRREIADLRQQFDAGAPAAGNRAPVQGPRAAVDLVSPREIARRVAQFLRDNGALVQVNDAGRDHGQIRAFSNRTYDPDRVPPTLVMRNEDFGRIARLVEYGDGAVELEVDIVNQMYPEGRTVYNAIAEIEGSDKADEVIMLGGHLDSWHAATGATDNAIGSAVMMEAARILRAVGVQPRRTIRVALWGGEEQGLLGSQAYVAEHFGTAENPKPAHEKFGGYFNIDSGTGRVRGATVFGPSEAAEVLREVLVPFSDYGVVGAATTRSRRRGGSDHTSFNEAGLPGISMRQDPIQYGTYTWHTNLDTYERVIEEDAKKSAIVIATAVYHLATRDELLPRFEGEAMPSLPTPTSSSQ